MTTKLLVDSNGLLCRSWWATSKGFMGSFVGTVDKVKPEGASAIYCWDSPHGSWRRDIFPAYKANRKPKPLALVAALEECRAAFPGPMVEGYEADDIIATLARSAGPEDVSVILSSDKDLLQLVGGTCLMVDYDGEVFDVDAVAAKMGVPPDRIRHLLSWMGDKVDGLPGVAGFGMKRARERALAGEVGYSLTYDLTELATIPAERLE